MAQLNITLNQPLRGAQRRTLDSSFKSAGAQTWMQWHPLHK